MKTGCPDEAVGMVVGGIDTPLGRWTAIWENGALCALITDPAAACGEEFPPTPEAKQLKAWLANYFAGRDPGALPLAAPVGTPFQQRVWALLAAIPYGQTTTYGALARILEQQTGRRASAQAVGQAVGRNPVAVVIPCHRVIGADGSLTGYAGGLPLKQALLRLEGHDR